MMTSTLALVVPLVLAQATTVTRQEIMSRADALSHLSWHMSDANKKGKGCPSGYLSDHAPGPQVGMPYKWGGFDDQSSFLKGVADGKGAGSHESNGVLTCAVGQDCSGFVSRAWGLPQHLGTTQLAQVAHGIKTADLKPGDILNRAGSHVVLFAALRDDGVPIFFEASGGADKVHLNSSASWAYLNGYSPMRSSTLADETPSCVGTAESPIIIPSLPYHDSRSTFVACSHRFNEYSCKPDARETGGEFIYRLQIPKRATVEATVANGAETDIDLQLLSKLDANACVARGDVTLRAVVDPGTYFLVADTWTDQRSGQYALEVKLAEAPSPTGPSVGVHETAAGGAPAPPKQSCGTTDSSAMLILLALGPLAVMRRKSRGGD